ncbi:hypothetical protein COB57_00395 [Candidatus Peregrinibacteria bacterium]|nr:MAG: hypothetical protein COB57_00395 [Candidatus Peregrinibacteria bacterium]
MKKLIFFLLLLIPSTAFAAANISLKVSTSGNNGTWDTNIEISTENDYYYQLIYTGGSATDDIEITLPNETTWNSKLSGTANPILSNSNKTLTWSNTSFVIYKWKANTSSNVITTIKQARVDTNDNGSFTDLFSNKATITISTSPKIQKATFIDLDNNGKLDNVHIDFSQSISKIAGGSPWSNGFAITNTGCGNTRTISNESLSSVGGTDNRLTFTLNECDVNDTGIIPDISYTGGNILNLSNTISLDINKREEASPICTTCPTTMKSTDTSLDFIFSEKLENTTFSIKKGITTYTSSISNNTLTLTENPGVGSHALTLSVQDFLGNTQSHLLTLIVSAPVVDNNSSGGGGGGGGGGSTGPTTNTYNIPSYDSNTELNIERPIATKDGVFHRTVLMTDYYSKSSIQFSKDTIITKDNEPFTDAIKPISRIFYKNIKHPLPENSLIYTSIFTVLEPELRTSKPIDITIIPSASLLSALEKQDFSIQKYNFQNEKWEIIDLNIEDIREKKQLEFSLSQGTHIAITTPIQSKKKIIFEDMKDHWAAEYVEELRAKNIIQGKGNTGQFAPNDPITRAAFLKIVMELFPIEAITETENIFEDVETGSWYEPYVLQAYQNNIIQGYKSTNGKRTFQPGTHINRAEALAIIIHASKIQIEETTSDHFSDVPQESWFAKYVNFAYDKNVIKGKQPKIFAPEDSITRAEAAKIILLMYKISY